MGCAVMVETGRGSVIDRTVELSALRRDGVEFPIELTIWASRGSDGGRALQRTHPGHHRTRSDAGPAVSAGLPRRADGPAQPRALPRPGRQALRGADGDDARRRPVPRPRRLQDRQRQPRPRRRRPAAEGRGGAAARCLRGGDIAGAARRRRVRRAARRRGRRRRARSASPSAWSRRSRSRCEIGGHELSTRPPASASRCRIRRGATPARAAARRGHGDVRRQAAVARAASWSSSRGCTPPSSTAPRRSRAELAASARPGEFSLHYQPIVGLRDGACRRRGARPLAAPGARAARAGRVPPARRGERARSGDRATGSCSRPAGSSPPGRLRPRTAARSVAVNVSSAHAARRPGVRRRGPSSPRRRRLPAAEPGARDHRERADGRRRHAVARADGAARSASGSPSTTSAPATRRWPTCARFPVRRAQDRPQLRPRPRPSADPQPRRAVVQMAHSLDLAVTAEGIETVDQGELRTQLGCDSAQGYLFARPLRADQVTEHLRQGIPLAARTCSARRGGDLAARVGVRTGVSPVEPSERGPQEVA